MSGLPAATHTRIDRVILIDNILGTVISGHMSGNIYGMSDRWKITYSKLRNFWKTAYELPKPRVEPGTFSSSV